MDERKKRILFVYDSMILGGSTTALLSLLNCMNTGKYDIDLQLYRNEGPLMNCLPSYVRLLPEAEIHKGSKGKIIKLLKCFFSGYAIKALIKGIKKTRRLHLSAEILEDFQAYRLSRKNTTHYDYAISFLEGWSSRYLAFCTVADKKYAWIHSTFANITQEPQLELQWMNKVDRIVFVTDACRMAFEQTLPQMAEKALTIENITDSRIIKERSLMVDWDDRDYQEFINFSGFKIVTVCRISIKVKGLDRIVNSVRMLKQQSMHFLWVVIGDGEDQEALKKIIRDAGVEDCIKIIGKRMNPYPFLAAADVMCMLSRYEGKPLAVTESLILGTPPVVTAYLSAHEQIKDGKEGLVLPNEDDRAETALCQCFSCPDQFTQMRNYLHNHEYGNSDYINKIEEALFRY